MHLTKITLSLISFIFISSFFAQGVWSRLLGIFGQQNLIFFSYGIFLLFVVSFLLRKRKQGCRLIKIFFALIIIFVGVAFSFKIKLFAERVHLFEFGLLGYLVIRDFSKEKASYLKITFCSLLFIFFIACIDETIQWFLPQRVGEFRDVLFNLFGGSLGLSLFLLFPVFSLQK